MWRLSLYVVIFFGVLPGIVLGEEQQPLPSQIQNLDVLLDVPLPGEKGPPASAPKTADLDGLKGRTITLVTAIDPAPGFEPVREAGISLGSLFDAAIARQTVVRLWETGNYSDVKIYAQKAAGNGVEILIAVQPMFRIRRLEISGNDALDNEDIEKAVEYIPDRTIRPESEVLRTLRGNLLKAYSERGYRDAEATLRLETTEDPGGVALVIQLDEGRPERYVRIRTPRLPDDLEEARITESVGIKPGMIRHRESAEESIKALHDKLASLGYRDANVGPVRERLLKRYEVELMINIEPNIKTEFAIKGNDRFRREELIEVFVGEISTSTNQDAMRIGMANLQSHYRKHGYFHTRVHLKRFCHRTDGKTYLAPKERTCEGKATRQTLKIDIAEGPLVSVHKIIFSGNTYFEDSDLEAEVFAFLKERHNKANLFQPFSTASIDELGLSDKRPENMEVGTGIKAPNLRFSRTYVPKLYQKSMEHLVEIYQEKGFLGVRVSDTCDISKLSPRRIGKMHYRPFRIQRNSQSKSSSESDITDTPCVLINDDFDHLIVLVNIEENAQTTLSEVRFEGNSIFAARVLQETSGLSVGDPYNEFRLRQSAREIGAFYKGNGYMFADVEWDNSFSADMERARVRFTVDEGPRCKVGQIRIEGAETTSKKLIKERLTLASGDLITPKQIEESQQRLMELGILDGATIQMVAPEEAGEVKNLRVMITEGKPQYLELKGGIATVEGLRGGFEYGYRNLGGWALNARLRLRANYRLFFLGTQNPVIAQFKNYYDKLPLLKQIERHILLGLGQSHLPGTKGHLGWSLDAINQLLNEPAYSADRYTAFLRVMTAHPIGAKHRRALVAELRTGLELNDITVLTLQALRDTPSQPDFNQIPKELSRMPEGKSLFWVTGIKTSLDFRDHPFNPKRGIVVTLGADYVHSLAYDATEITTLPNGDLETVHKISRLIRAQSTVSGYIPFGDTDFVLALSISAGYVFHLKRNSTTWADRYFYAGGVETLRGFPEESLVPEDIYQKWKTTLKESSDDANALLRSSGGEMFLIGRIEFRYPLGKGFSGALFGEAGNVWRDTKNVVILDTNPLDVHLRPVAGSGLRYLTPLGPIAFDLGINLFRRPHEERFAWFFSIGSAF